MEIKIHNSKSGGIRAGADFEALMHDQTEWPGEKIALEDLHVISHRYSRILGLCVDADVLEIGSGSTIGKREIAISVKSFVSIDLSKENIIRSKSLYYELDFCQLEGDAHNLPFEDDSFDTVIALAMIYYLDSETFLREAKRVLRPGGKLFFCSSNKDVPGFVEAPGSNEYLSIPEWSTRLSQGGFDVSFEGVFKKSHLLPLGMRANLIHMVKSILTSLGLSNLWGILRGIGKGDKSTIPELLSEFPPCDELAAPLSANEVNKIYRVFYCECTAIKET